VFKVDQALDSVQIPDNNSTGITRTFDFSAVPPLRVEQVEVELSIAHDFRGDLQVELISPTNVVSTLMTKSNFDDGTIIAHLFSSNRHWGEASTGLWKLRIKDLAGSDVGTYDNATLTLYGESAPAARLASSPSGDYLLRAGLQSPITEFEATGTGRPNLAFSWKRGTGIFKTGITNTPISSKYSLPTVTTTHAGIHNVTVSNATGKETSTSFRIGVLAQVPPLSWVNIDSTLTLSAPATVPTGATASYQWKKNGDNIMDDPVGPTARIKGTSTKTLTVLKAAAGDAATYECFVTMGSASQTSGATALSIRYKPQIQLDAFPTDWIVSGASPVLGLNLLHGATKVSISGLPSGMSYDRVTGAISGTPSVPVTDKPITISVTNLAGTTTKVINLTVAPLTPMVIGTFNGLVGRNNLPAYNRSFGGAISSLVVSSSGTFTGKLIMGSQTPWSFSGRLSASTTAAPAATVNVRRGSQLAPLTLQFSIDRDTGHLTGTLTEQPALVTSVDAWRRTPSATVGLRHNFTLDPGSVDSALAPAGFSAGYLTHTPKTGAIAAVVKLADGTTVTKTTSRGFEGDIPLFAMLYANKGSLHGKLVVTDAAAPALDPVTGSFTWNKTGATSTKDYIYPTGFDFGVAAGSALPVEGSEYVAPIKAALPNPPNILWGITDVPVGQPNAILDFVGAGVETSAYYLADPSNINKTLRISGTHSIAFPLPNLAAVKLTLSATTGQISGSLTLKDGTPAVTRTLSYFGVILSPQAKAKGWFKLTQLPGPSIQSGKVELTE
jgi:subtilisin-like proprotein convertase family protein